MKRFASLVLITGLLAGCNVPLLPTTKLPTSVSNQPVEPLGGVTFKPISAVNARLLNGATPMSTGASGTVAKSAAPMAAPAANGGAEMASGAMIARDSSGGGSATAAGGAYSGNVWGGYSYVYGSYFNYGGYGMGGNTDPMALVSVTEAEAGGTKGGFQDAIKTVCAPILKAWANDARLIQSNATLNPDGSPYTGSGQDAPMVSKGGLDAAGSAWRLTYTSPARNEMLTFYVGATKTLVIRMRWAPLSLAPELVTVDSASAIKKLTAAIADKTFKGEEEKTGLDYFLGTTFDQPQAYSDSYSRTEPIYELAGKGVWNVTLNSVLGKLVWQLDYNGQGYPSYADGGVVAVGSAVAVAEPAQPMVKFSVARTPMVMPSPSMPPVMGEWRESYTNNYANGMVDAQTGAVIRFSRPTKQFYRDMSGQYPTPTPIDTPLPPKESPKPAPSATPSTGVVEGSEGDTGETTTAAGN